MDEWIELDGRMEEGGGSILRHALGFSILTGRPFYLHHIRVRRPQPGLRPQHLHAVQAAASFCNAEVEGATIGSTTLRFRPGKPREGTFEIDIGTAGSTTLLLQALLLPIVWGPVTTTWRVRGGTDVPWSIPADYFHHVLLPVLRRWARLSFRIERRGYYPAGGGEVVLEASPGLDAPTPLELDEPGEVERVEGVAHASTDLKRARVAERMRDTAVRAVQRELAVSVNIRTDYRPTRSTGAGLVLWATVRTTRPGQTYRLGASALGQRGVPSEQVAMQAAQALLDEYRMGACVDRHLADQLVPFLAWVGGVMRTSELTAHTRASVAVARAFLPDRTWRIEGTRIVCERLGGREVFL